MDRGRIRIGQVLGVIGMTIGAIALFHHGSSEDADRAASRAVDAVAAEIDGPAEAGASFIDPAEVARERGYDELRFTSVYEARGPDPADSAYTVTADDASVAFCMRVDHRFDPFDGAENRVDVREGACTAVSDDTGESPGSTAPTDVVQP